MDSSQNSSGFETPTISQRKIIEARGGSSRESKRYNRHDEVRARGGSQMMSRPRDEEIRTCLTSTIVIRWDAEFMLALVDVVFHLVRVA